jgi:DNA-binding IclR family transcriptional regulator
VNEIEDEVLHEVQETGPATAAELAATSGFSESTVRRYLHKLENAGKVESDDYHRRGRVWMTP